MLLSTARFTVSYAVPVNTIALTWSSCPVREATTYVSFDELEFGRSPVCGVVYKRTELSNFRSTEFYEKSYFHDRKSGRDKRFEHPCSRPCGTSRA